MRTENSGRARFVTDDSRGARLGHAGGGCGRSPGERRHRCRTERRARRTPPRAPCHTPGVERCACLESPNPARRIAHARGAPQSSSSPADRAALRLYCNHACRQRAYEHRHGFEHQRTVRPLPGQVDRRLVVGYRLRARRLDGTLRANPCPAHQRRPEGRAARNIVRRSWRDPSPASTSPPCILGPVAPVPRSADSNPLRYGISASNELSRLRSLLDDIDEQRVPPTTSSTGFGRTLHRRFRLPVGRHWRGRRQQPRGTNTCSR